MLNAPVTTPDFDTVYDRTGTENSKWHHFPPDVLPMYVADMDFRSPEPVIRALRERVEHGFFGYGIEQPEFYEVVCDRLWRRYRWRVAPEAIVTFPGVISAFNLAVKTFATPGDGVLIHMPAYGPILNCPERYGMTRDEAQLVQGSDGRYEVDWDSFERACSPRTRIFLNCNPHNPAGRVFTREELARMTSICMEKEILIVSDEIHSDIVYPGHEHTPIATLSPEVEARTITLMAPSKTFNLPGLKASIAIIPDAGLRERMVAARTGLVTAVNILGYTACLAAYRDCDPWLSELIPYLHANRDYAAAFIAERMPALKMTVPEGTYLAWIDCRGAGIPGADPRDFFLEQAKVGLSSGVDFGAKGFVRLNFACPRSMLTGGLERMARALASMGNG